MLWVHGSRTHCTKGEWEGERRGGGDRARPGGSGLNACCLLSPAPLPQLTTPLAFGLQLVVQVPHLLGSATEHAVHCASVALHASSSTHTWPTSVKPAAQPVHCRGARVRRGEGVAGQAEAGAGRRLSGVAGWAVEWAAAAAWHSAGGVAHLGRVGSQAGIAIGDAGDGGAILAGVHVLGHAHLAGQREAGVAASALQAGQRG